MTKLRFLLVAVVFSLMGWVAPVANADCTTAGDFGAGAGCSPPGSGSDNSTQSWPPTSVDWPPQLKSMAGSDSDSDDKGGDTKSVPIVMPSGQKPPPAATTSTSTSATPTPIVIPQH
jgi:hypothetical protein